MGGGVIGGHVCKLRMSLLSPKGEIFPISYVLLPPPTPGNCVGFEPG